MDYDPELDLVFCFDFNTTPGTATVIQEHPGGSYCIRNMYVPSDSNTPLICKMLLKHYREHTRNVYIYGDATGGAKGTSQKDGSDWDNVKIILRSVYRDRLIFCVPKSNPLERIRVNALNSRVCNTIGQRALFVDSRHCQELAKDFMATRMKDDGTLDKDTDKLATHLTDGVGYYIVKRWPIFRHKMEIQVY